MGFTLRPAVATDQEAIAAFTTETFSWGDYVADAFTIVAGRSQRRLIVAVDGSDTAVAMGVGRMLSSDELWLQGARVHPDWRRQGIASAIDDELEKWAGSGAPWCPGSPSRTGTRPPSPRWSGSGCGGPRCGRRRCGPRPTEARPAGNGGRRRRARDRLDQAPSAESAPAYMAWSTSELGRAARGLVAIGWTWRRLTAADLQRAARGQALWMSSAGWVLAARNGERLESGWMAGGPDELPDLLAALTDLARELGAGHIDVKLPAAAVGGRSPGPDRFHPGSPGLAVRQGAVTPPRPVRVDATGLVESAISG